MDTSAFRNLIESLSDVRGDVALWPSAFGCLLEKEFQRHCKADSTYARDVFIDRDARPLKEGDNEVHLVSKFYDRLTTSPGPTNGVVTIGTTAIWLLGYQWPTQGGNREKGRKADLVGITTEGSLVVFEAKVASGAYPLIAVLEGLDYLSCLLQEGNFCKLEQGFQKWRSKKQKSNAVPSGFEHVKLDRSGKPRLIVIAPGAYYTGRHARSIRSQDLLEYCRLGDAFMQSVTVQFATTDFKSSKLTLFRPPESTKRSKGKSK